MPVPVLLKSDTDRQLVNTCTDPSQTAGDLKAAIAESQGLPPACVTKVLLHGEELPDSQQLSSVGIASNRATVQAAGCQLFPNSWFESPYAKTYTKVLDITWPPLRQADYTLSFAWVALLLAALAAANSILP